MRSLSTGRLLALGVSAALIVGGVNSSFAAVQYDEKYSTSQSNTQREIAKLRELLEQQQRKLQQQEEENARQRALLEQQSQQLARQNEQFQKLSRQFDYLISPAASALQEMELEQFRALGVGHSHSAAVDNNNKKQSNGNSATVADGGDASGDAPDVVGSDRKPEEPERPPEIAAYIEEGGVLLPRGTLVVTPQIGYLNSSATRVAIEGFSIIPALNIGLFEVAELSRDTVTAAISLRYGVTNRFEISTKIPYVYREDSTRSRPIGAGSSSDVLSRVDGYGIGDIEFGAHYQINDGKEGWPYLIGNIRFKSTTGTSPFEVSTDPATGLQTELPTGSGFMALQPSVTAIYRTDPGVIYGNLGYLFNFEDNVGTIGTINPGDSVSASIGLSVALNDTSSFSLGYAHNTVFKTEQNGSLIPNSRNLQVGTIDFGYSHRVSDSTSLNLNVSAGATEDAPDASVVLRMPMRFNLFD